MIFLLFTIILARKKENWFIRINFFVNFSTIDLSQYEYAEFMLNLGVPQSHWDLFCKGGWRNFEIQGAPSVNGSPQNSKVS